MSSRLEYQREPKYFAQYQQLISVVIIILFFQLPFFAVIYITLFAFLTFNSAIVAIEGFLIIFTYTIKKSTTFIWFVRKFIVPTAYFKEFYRIFQQEIPKGTKTIFCLHPHAVFGYCMIANMNCGNDKMTEMIGLASRFIFNIPLIGALFRLYGLESVDPVNLQLLMTQGYTIGIFPGGFEEATLTTPYQMRIYIKKRLGFVKYALKYGYTIYPTICLNEHKQFATFDKFLQLRHQINKLKIPGVFFFSKWLLFLNPNFQMITVVGRGIKIQEKQKTESPSNELIAQVHRQYIEQIERLYEKYKHLNGHSPLALY